MSILDSGEKLPRWAQLALFGVVAFLLGYVIHLADRGFSKMATTQEGVVKNQAAIIENVKALQSSDTRHEREIERLQDAVFRAYSDAK
jgi:hypothetical protein